MPPALAAALPAVIAGLTGAAGAGVSLIASKKAAKAKEKEAALAYGKPTESGFDDFGGDMAGGFNKTPNLSLNNARRPVVFNRQ